MTKTLGTLFLVGTPLGNLEDMTFRAVRVLTEAGELYCEDTRRTAILLKHFKIERRNGPKSFHDHSPRPVLTKIRAELEQGKSVAYVTDGGMPVVSDPGFVLAREALAAGAAVTAVPGPSAAVSLFAVSGLASPKYLFHGFFPQTRGEVERVLELVRELPVAHIFYESPSRAVKSLAILAKHFPEAKLAFGRELTKIHEEVVRGTLDEVYAELAARERIRGECVFAILQESRGQNRVSESGLNAAAADALQPVALSEGQKAEIAALIQSGHSSKDVSKELSKKFGISRRVIYEFIVKTLT